MKLTRAFLAFVLCFGLVCVAAHAEETVPAVKDFSIAPSGEWMELPPSFQNVVASYGKKGTLATFYITARDLEETKKVQDLNWADLFKPQFESIDIRTEGETVIGGERSRYCVYLLKPGEFKTKMEGKLPAKYMNYVFIHGTKLFSVTFKDTLDGFAMNYPSFTAAIRTLKFTGPSSQAKGAGL